MLRLHDFVRAVGNLSHEGCEAGPLFNLTLAVVKGTGPRLGCPCLISPKGIHLVLKCFRQLLKHLLILFVVTLICQLHFLDSFLGQERIHLLFVYFLLHRVV